MVFVALVTWIISLFAAAAAGNYWEKNKVSEGVGLFLVSLIAGLLALLYVYSNAKGWPQNSMVARGGVAEYRLLETIGYGSRHYFLMSPGGDSVRLFQADKADLVSTATSQMVVDDNKNFKPKPPATVPTPPPIFVSEKAPE